MATIVQHRSTGKRCALLGASYSVWKSARANRFWGDIAPVESEGTVQTVAVCNVSGDVLYFPAAEITVVTVDGVSPDALLGTDTSQG